MADDGRPDHGEHNLIECDVRSNHGASGRPNEARPRNIRPNSQRTNYELRIVSYSAARSVAGGGKKTRLQKALFFFLLAGDAISRPGHGFEPLLL